MAENVGDAEVSISGDLRSLKSFVLEVKRALSSLERGKVDVTLDATDKITPEVKKITREVDALDRKKATPLIAADDKATAVFERVGREVKRVHGQKATPVIDVHDEATAKLTRIGESIKRYLTGGAIVAGVYFLGRAVKSLAGSMIDGAADMEQYQNTLEIVMGSAKAAGDTLAWVVQFAKKTPFEIPGLMEATVRLQAYGIDATKVLGTIGDASSALGKDVMAGVEAVADAQTGEFERLKEFGIKAVEVGKDQLKTYALGADAMGKTMLLYTDKHGKEAFKIVDRNNREIVTSNIMAIWNERYAGAMERQSTTWKGMISNLKDFIGQGLTKIGASILPVLKPYVDQALAYLSSPEFAAVITRVAEWVKEAIPKIADFARTAFGFIKSVWDAFAGPAFTVAKVALGAFSGALKLLTDNMNILKPVIIGMVAAWAGWKILSTVSGWVTSLGGLLGGLTGHTSGLTRGASQAGQAVAAWSDSTGKASAGISGMLGPIGAVAGAAVGLGLGLWQTIKAENAQAEAFWKATVEASKQTGQLDTLRAATANLTVGTTEYNAALDAQAAKAQEIIDKTQGLGAVYDSTGRLIDANSQFINFLGMSMSGTGSEIARFAAKVQSGNATLAEAYKIYGKGTESLADQEKKVRSLEAAMMEKAANNKKISTEEYMALNREEQKYAEMAKGASVAFESMKQLVDDFTAKITDPEKGLSAMTGKDVGAMMKMFQDKTPEVRQLGLTMLQQIVNAEIAKRPEIEGGMRAIMGSLEEKIRSAKPGEITAAKLREMVAAEIAVHPECAGAMQSIMDAMSGKIGGTDLGTPTAGVMGQMESAINNAKAAIVAAAQRIADAFRGVFDNMSAPTIPTPRPKVHGGGLIPTFHGGGHVGVRMHSGGEVQITALPGEYMMRREAVQKYGLGFMEAVNSGRLGSRTHHHIWGPVSFPNVRTGADAQDIRDELNAMAERADDYRQSGGGYRR